MHFWSDLRVLLWILFSKVFTEEVRLSKTDPGYGEPLKGVENIFKNNNDKSIIW